MLVLTRKTGEQLVIADNITITIVEVGPGRVKIGIDAPSDVRVDRKEIHDRKQAEAPVPSTAPGFHNRVANLAPVRRSVDPRKPR